MDPNQFQQMMAMLAQCLQSSQTIQPPVHNVNVVGNFDSFDAEKESFENYKQRLENFLQLKNVFGDKHVCAKVLLNCIGPRYYELVKSLAAPEDVTVLGYDKVVELLSSHLCPKPNVVVQQHRFMCRFQGATESVADFIAELRRLASTCSFKCDCGKSISDIFLRAQFIRGLRDTNIRERILTEEKETLTLQKAIDVGLGLEASRIDNAEMSKQCQSQVGSSSNTSNINLVNKSIPQNKFYQDDRSKSRSRRENRDNRSRPRSKSRLNYKDLGIDHLCIRCGRDNHKTNECRIALYKLKCEFCKKEGHVATVCISKLLKNQSKAHQYQRTKTDSVNNIYKCDFSDICIVDIFKNSDPDVRKYFVNVYIEGVKQRFEVDSGAGYTLISESLFKSLSLQNVQIKPANVRFRSYTSEIFDPIGVVEVHVQYKNKVGTQKMYIVPGDHVPLLGRSWIRQLDINLKELDLVNDVNNQTIYSVETISKDLQQIKSQFSTIFKPVIGCVKNFKCSLKMRDNAKPTFFKAREVPYALREKVEQELSILEEQGIISKADSSDWGSPLVIIPKPDSTVRLCADYKIGVNPQIVQLNYPIPKITEMIDKLRNAKYFCTLDLFKAYLHIPVDEKSSKIQTVTTHRGTYIVDRLSFGIKSAPRNPSTNGLAERYVQILKNKLKMMAKDPMPLHWKIREIMFRFRATPLKSGKSPAEIYLNRPFRTKLDAMRPNPVQKSNDISTLRHRILKVGDRVQSRHYPTKSWKYGIIIRKLGNLHYIVKLDDGYMIKRHINQLIKSEINSCGDNIKKSVSFENPLQLKMNSSDVVKEIVGSHSEEHERRNQMRLYRRGLRDTQNPFEVLSDREFVKTFRYSKELAKELIDTLNPNLNVSRRRSAIPPYLKVLVALQFLGHGAYQHGVGRTSTTAMSQPCISRAISTVCTLITELLMPNWIKFPTTLQEKASTKGFYQRFGFRGVLVCIDGTHVQIISPPATDADHPPHVYINRKGVRSINVMLIRDASSNILACDARYPGSVHDSAIWGTSDVRNYFRNEFQNGDRHNRLIGDSGYPLEPWLFTPFNVVQAGTPEARYNDLHKSTRNVIERTNGIMKGRFRSLLKHRVLHYHPAKAAYIIYAAAVLHNIALWANLELQEGEMVLDDVEHEHQDGHVLNDENLLRLGRNERAAYIRLNIR
ncbi:hypothetical protein PPYR_09056 [Photinus pyralis]|uniref:CCHC-type domain-containing protein n=2 Tax=Photinus pyralis TaxID=7054 RepID=A0A5N4ALB3_PHOPY|nr:hypothetical protein PPYR_09056 [Photinus pyralis]